MYSACWCLLIIFESSLDTDEARPHAWPHLVPIFCLFDLILYVPVSNFSVMSGRVFLGWTTKQRIKSLAQGQYAAPPMRLEPAAPRCQALYHWATMLLRGPNCWGHTGGISDFFLKVNFEKKVTKNKNSWKLPIMQKVNVLVSHLKIMQFLWINFFSQNSR